MEKAIEAIGYILKYQDLVESLETNLQTLDDRLSTINLDVHYFNVKQRRVIRDEVMLWIQQVGKERDAAKEFIQTTDRNANGLCCGHDCDWGKRYHDAKEAKNHGDGIRNLMAEGEQFDKDYFTNLDPEPMAQFWASGYVSVPSMDQTIEQLKKFLQGDEMLVVGIYGGEDVGKTTLAKKFAAEMESGGVFKVVVTNGLYDEEKIRGEIAERIGFEFATESETERAQSLHERLLAIKVLIVFDNVDHKIDLSAIGVPQPAPDNACRILVVSTTSDTCEAMHSKKNLEIKPLNQEESKIFAAGLVTKYELSDYSLAFISSNEAWLPSEIEQHMAYQSPITSSLAGEGISTFLIDADALEIAHKDAPQYWRLDRSKSSPEAVLNHVWFLNIEGKTKGLQLLPQTNYGAYFVYQLSDNAKGFNINPVEMIVGRNSKLCYLDPSKSSFKNPTRRTDKWLEIEMGRFYSDDYAYSPVDLLVKNNDTSIVKSGLRIHGIELRQMIVSPSIGAGIHTFLLDADAIDIAHKDAPQCWILDRSKSSPEAVLKLVWFLDIEWKAMGLFPGTNYGAYFVYQLSDNAKGFNINQVELIVGKNSKSCYLDPSKSSNEKPVERADKWLEIEMGRFYDDEYADSPMDMIVRDHDTSIVKSGLRIHGIELRELNVSPSSGGRASTILLDADAIQISHKDNPQHWRLDGSKFSPEAELMQVSSLNIKGKVIGLFPGTNYGAYFVYQLSDNAKGFNKNPVEMIVGRNSKLFYLDPSMSSYEKPTRRADNWLEIEMGRFYSDDYAYSMVNLVIKDHDTSIVKSGLRIHCIELRQLAL